MRPVTRTKVALPRSLWRGLNIAFYEIAFLVLAFYATKLIPSQGHRPHMWLLGDWLINYQGGFVRRGLTGEILLQVSTLSGIRVEILAAIFLTLLYLVFLTSACRLSMGSSFSLINFLLVFSPAFILFPILDPNGGFRKELLLFALLATLCIRLRSSDAKIPKYLPAFIGLACAGIVLSHEMLIVYLPYVLCPLILHEDGLGSATRKTVLFMIPSAAIVVLVAIFGQGSHQTVRAICESLKTSAPVDCVLPDAVPGAISFLEKDLADALSFVRVSNPASTLWVYAASAVLSFTPVVLKVRSREFGQILVGKRAGFWLIACISVAVLASLPLLWVVADYGRLIYLHVACLSLVTLAATQERTPEPLQFHLSLKHVGIWVACLLFISSWRLLHHAAPPEETFVLYSAISGALGR